MQIKHVDSNNLQTIDVMDEIVEHGTMHVRCHDDEVQRIDNQQLLIVVTHMVNVAQKQEPVQMDGYNDHTQVNIVEMITHLITMRVRCHDDEVQQIDNQQSLIITGTEIVTQREDIVIMEY